MVNIRNVLIAVGFLFIFVFMSAISILILDGMITSIETSTVYNSDMDSVINKLKATYYWYDYIVPIMVLVFLIGIGVTSYRLRTTPIGYIVSFLSMGFLGFLSYFFNYVFLQMMSEAKIAVTQVYFPKSMILCTNLHWIALIMFIVGSIMLFNNVSQPQGEVMG